MKAIIRTHTYILKIILFYFNATFKKLKNNPKK